MEVKLARGYHFHNLPQRPAPYPQKRDTAFARNFARIFPSDALVASASLSVTSFKLILCDGMGTAVVSAGTF